MSETLFHTRLVSLNSAPVEPYNKQPPHPIGFLFHFITVRGRLINLILSSVRKCQFPQSDVLKQ
jgi:hypothetical protein